MKRSVFGGWTRRDWAVTLVVGLLSGALLIGWGKVTEYLLLRCHFDQTALGWSYPVWFLPGLVTMALVRKPGACLAGELLAGLFEFLYIAAFVPTAPVTTCSFAGCDLYFISGLVQGLGGELGFALLGYRGLGPAAFALAGMWSWWLGWLKGAFLTSCYQPRHPGILLTATISTAAVAAALGALVRATTTKPQAATERGAGDD